MFGRTNVNQENAAAKREAEETEQALAVCDQSQIP
jgi:hypothetical protein